ncbi:protein NEDD1-like isoform X2 [Ambystoma mexicanum]
MQENTYFASSAEDIKIWDYSTLTVVNQFNPHTSFSGISSLCWSPTNDFLASAAGSGDKIVISAGKSIFFPLFDLAAGEKQTILHLNHNSQYLASGGFRNTVNIWELKSRSLYRSYKDHKDDVTCLRFDGNGSLLASGSMSGEIILHNVVNNLFSLPFGHGKLKPIRRLKYSSQKKYLLGSLSDIDTVTLWDANSQTCYHTFDHAHQALASDVCFCPKNDWLLATVGLDRRITLYDIFKKDLYTNVLAEAPLTAVDFSPDGLVLTVGTSCGKMYQYDLRMMTSPVRTVAAHTSSVQSIQFQHSKLSAKFCNKISSRRSSVFSVNKRASLKGNPNAGEGQNSNIGMCRRASLDVLSSMEKDFVKYMDLHITNLYGRSSLGDLFSPAREVFGTNKANGDFPAKGDGPTLATSGVTNSSTEKDADAVEGDGTGAALSSVQIDLIKDMIQESAEYVRQTCHQEIVHLQVEMIKQFHIQLNEMHVLLDVYSVNDDLVTEMEKLREENKRLQDTVTRLENPEKRSLYII